MTTKLHEQPDGELLDKLVFIEGVGTHSIKYLSNTQTLGFLPAGRRDRFKAGKV